MLWIINVNSRENVVNYLLTYAATAQPARNIYDAYSRALAESVCRYGLYYVRA